MKPFSFFVDPTAAKDAVLSGRGLLVEIFGDRHQYRRVTVMDRPNSPKQPSDEKRAA